MFLQLLLISSVLLGLAFVGLAFRVLFIREGRFPETSVGKNKELRKLGLNCASHGEGCCGTPGKDVCGVRSSGQVPLQKF